LPESNFSVVVFCQRKIASNNNLRRHTTKPVAAGVSRRTYLCRITAPATWMAGWLPHRRENGRGGTRHISLDNRRDFLTQFFEFMKVLLYPST